MVYGIGDGGGGPGEEHLERLKRLENFAGLSPVKERWTIDFLKDWEKDSSQFPTWSGELYLERHQGTLTTNARNKRYNRRMELALRELEWTAALPGNLTHTYPLNGLEIWKEYYCIIPRYSTRVIHQSAFDESGRYASARSS
jgi:alpha-mannosidase